MGNRRVSQDLSISRLNACVSRLLPEEIKIQRGGGNYEVLAQLPSDYQPLFTAGSEGNMRLKSPRRRAARASTPTRSHGECGSTPLVRKSPGRKSSQREACETRLKVGPYRHSKRASSLSTATGAAAPANEI